MKEVMVHLSEAIQTDSILHLLIPLDQNGFGMILEALIRTIGLHQTNTMLTMFTGFLLLQNQRHRLFHSLIQVHGTIAAASHSVFMLHKDVQTLRLATTVCTLLSPVMTVTTRAAQDQAAVAWEQLGTGKRRSVMSPTQLTSTSMDASSSTISSTS